MTISGTNQIQNIYLYGKTHYNQMTDSAISPVRRIHGAVGVEKQDEQLNVAVTYRHDGEQDFSDADKVTAKERLNLSEEYEGESVVAYNASNPYERSRMCIEGSLLTGMNFDMFA